MQKIFIVAGELSGDKAAAWYLQKRNLAPSAFYLEGIGGDALNTIGVNLYDRFESLNVVGITEIICKIPFLYTYLQRLKNYLISQQFDEIILVNFSGFNLVLAQQLKKALPQLKITYFAPPQMWCWGAWRVQKLRSSCDQVDVLFPFEVSWYEQHNIKAQWLGNPIYDRLEQTMLKPALRKHQLACLIASRTSELKRLFPIFSQVLLHFLRKYPDLTCVMPIASSINHESITACITNTPLKSFSDRIMLTDGNAPQTLNLLQECCMALTKPGTVSLELALLGIPAVVAYKTSWLTYIMAKSFVQVPYMALPNLLLNQEVYPEYIQGACTPHLIVPKLEDIYREFTEDKDRYHSREQSLLPLRQMLGSTSFLLKA